MTPKDAHAKTAGKLLADAIKTWIGYVASHCSESTYLRYKGVIYRFADYLPADITIENITVEHLENYVNSLPVSNSTKNTVEKILKSFYSWAAERYKIDNQAAKLKLFKCCPHQRFLTEDEYSKAFAVADERAKNIMQLLSHTGLRVSEMLSVGSRDAQNGLLHVIGKGQKPRTIPLSQTAKDALAYLVDGNILISKSLPNRSGIGNILRRTAEIAGIEPFSCHALRRLFANRLRRQNIDIYTIAKVMGHTKLETTMLYFKLDGIELAGLTGFMDG